MCVCVCVHSEIQLILFSLISADFKNVWSYTATPPREAHVAFDPGMPLTPPPPHTHTQFLSQAFVFEPF